MPVLGYLPATEHRRAPGQRSEENNVTGFDRPDKETELPLQPLETLCLLKRIFALGES